VQGRVTLRIFQILSGPEVEVVGGKHSQNFKLVIKGSNMGGSVDG
jgi:hypothetical protein